MSEDKEHLLVHIEGLQATLTKRNARIAQLEARLASPSSDIAKAEQRGYKKGWQACASHLMETTRKAACDLAKVRKDAFEAYLKGEAE